MKLLFIALLVLSASVLPAVAQTPTPSSHPTKDVDKKLKQTKEKEKQLKSELKSIQSELSSKKKSLVEVASEITQNEQQLSEVEKAIEKKVIEKEEIETRLDTDRKSISDLVLALQRINRIPPEAIIAKPDSPLKIAQSTMLLESILPRIYKRADQLKVDLKRLDTLLVDLEQDKKTALNTSAKLKKDKQALAALLSQREAVYAKTEKNIAQQQVALKQISAQARDLKDLVKRIEQKQKKERAKEKKRQKRERQQAKATKAVPPPTRPTSTPIPKAGQAQLPVSGYMTVRYGKTDEIGAVSKGVKIKTRANALIVAPMGGVVEYAGKFKGHGRIIILKHQKGYHSLVAGLGEIDTVVGRAVSAGEPIGKMSSSTGNDADITLYYELRLNGKTVNPSKRISGL